MKKEGLKADGTLKKGYRFAKGGVVVKAKSTTTNKKMTKSVTPNKKIKPVVSSKKKTTKTPVTAKKRKTLGNTTPIPSGEGLTEKSIWAMFRETNEAIKNVTRQIGGITKGTGIVAETIFQETFKEELDSKGFITIDGICFNKMAINFEIYKGVQSKKGETVRQSEGEIDVLLNNDNKNLFLIEIKFSRVSKQSAEATIKNMGEKINKLEEYFSGLTKNKEVKYGVAILGIKEDVRDIFLKNGIYVFTTKANGVITYNPNKPKITTN